MNFAHIHARGHGYGSPRALAELDRLVGIGITDLALNPFAYTPTLDSTSIRWGGDPTMTDDDILLQCRHAAGRGVRVMMKPHLWSMAFGSGKGNGDIDVADWPAWFASYTDYVVHYATVAAAGGATSLCVGLEFATATRKNPGAWAKVADACRRVYPGQILYAANWYEECETFTDWAAFDAVGVNAYFPLVGGTVDALAASWAPHLDRLQGLGRPVIFCEAGYRAVAGATERPWDTSVEGAADPGLQARAYEALLRAATARPWFQGVYWWKWFTDLNADDDDLADAFLPARRPAEAVLRSWFSERSQIDLRPATPTG